MKISDTSFVIGIGSSAGGLEALQSFIKGLPKETKDATFIVAQHLSPQHKSMLVELLGKTDLIKVAVAEDGITPEVGTMYITPPNADIEISGSKIRLSEPLDGAGPKPSVDRFFKSLAEDADMHAIGIVLSGTGSDGALGIQAIRSEGGITVAQTPESAKYDGMPQAAIDTDCVDEVLEPNLMGDYLAKVLKTGKKRPVIKNALKKQLEDVLVEVEAQTGLSFHGYKQTTLQRRLERRMVANGIGSLESYLEYVRSDKDEPAQLAQDFLISVTEFFRDKKAFATLGKEIESKLRSESSIKSLRVWSVGCATGEEAYSLGILCAEALGGPEQLSRHRIQVFATDIDSNALAIAREGCYNSAVVSGLPEEIRTKYFIAQEDKYSVIKPLKDITLFSRHNILENPPFSRIDILVCRNVLIYFSNDIQEKAFKIFHYSMVKDGLMFLGKSESPGRADSLFKRIEKPGNIYSKRVTSLSAPLGMKFSNANNDGRGRSLELKDAAESKSQGVLLSSIMNSLAPRSVLVNQNLDILHVYGDVSPFIRWQSGKPSMNLVNTIAMPFSQEIRVFSFKAIREKTVTRTSSRPMEINGKLHEATVQFHPIDLDSQEMMLLVVFEAEPVEEGRSNTHKDGGNNPDVMMLEQELQATQEHLQTVIEELETLNEELQSTNEELQSSNEELHSTNEELETSNEELQSTNEELTTVNDELNQKKTELEEGHDELTNIQNSVQFPLLRLNDNLQIVRSNSAAQQLFGLNPDSSLPLVRFLPDSIDIMDVVKHANDVIQGKEVEDIAVEFEDRNFWVRFYPYVTSKNEVVGVILTFFDETEQVKQRAKLHDSNARYSALASNNLLPIYIKDLEGRYLAANFAVQKLFDRSEEEILGKTDAELLGDSPNQHFRANDVEVQEKGKTLLFEETLIDGDKTITYLSVKAPLFDKNNKVYATSGISIDVTERKSYAEQLERSNQEIQKANQVKSDFLANMSHEIRTPLNAICGIAEILATFDVDENRRDDLINKLNAGAHQLYSLINDILDFSAIEGDEFKLISHAFDLGEVFEELRSINSVKAEQRGIGLNVEMPEFENRYFYGDKTRLIQILLNLVDNAIKFTNEGEVSLKVRESEENREKHSELTFEVSDTGIGIAEDQMTDVFKKFSQGQGDFSGKAKGTGLGLTITKALVERMDGSIKIKSKKGEGSTFTVTLSFPRANGTKKARGGKKRDISNDVLTSDYPILVVEDVEANIDVMCAFLEFKGLEYDVARDGPEAIEKATSNRYSLVLMDLQMDTVDGFEVTRRLRGHTDKAVNSIPIVAVTGHAEKSIRDKCIQLGMQDFLVKPINLKELTDVLAEWL